MDQSQLIWLSVDYLRRYDFVSRMLHEIKISGIIIYN